MLFLIMFIWQIPHFLALAMKRVDEYRNAGIPMLPVVHGFEITKRQIMIWTVCLLPLPFYMSGLGITFMVIATLLNIGWIVLGFYGFRKKDDIKFRANVCLFPKLFNNLICINDCSYILLRQRHNWISLR